MEEWKTYKFKDITTKIGSGATPSGGKESYLGGDIALIRSQNVLDLSFSCDGLAYISDEQAQKLSNVELCPNDTLINITGDSVARVCTVPSWVLPARVNQHVAIVRPDNSKVANKYLTYYLLTQKEFLISISASGATRKALTKGMLEDLDILLPPVEYQEKVVSILSSFDDKIDLNNRINHNLPS